MYYWLTQRLSVTNQQSCQCFFLSRQVFQQFLDHAVIKYLIGLDGHEPRRKTYSRCGRQPSYVQVIRRTVKVTTVFFKLKVGGTIYTLSTLSSLPKSSNWLFANRRKAEESRQVGLSLKFSMLTTAFLGNATVSNVTLEVFFKLFKQIFNA